MHENLASVRGTVDLSAREVLSRAATFLPRQGYTIVQHTDALLKAERRQGNTSHKTTPYLSVVTTQRPEGGVQVEVHGNDREGMQMHQAQWTRWA